MPPAEKFRPRRLPKRDIKVVVDVALPIPPSKNWFKLPIYIATGGLIFVSLDRLFLAWRAGFHIQVIWLLFVAISAFLIWLKHRWPQKQKPIPTPGLDGPPPITPYPRTNLCPLCGQDSPTPRCIPCMRKSRNRLILAVVALPLFIFIGAVLSPTPATYSPHRMHNGWEYLLIAIGACIGLWFCARAYLMFKQAHGD